MPPDPPRADWAVWDCHGGLTRAVRDELRNPTQRTAPKLETLCGLWRDHQVAVGWPRRVTRAHQPTLREAITGLQAGHRPHRLVLIGAAAAGRTDHLPGRVVTLGESSGVVTRWEGAARETLELLEIDAVLLAAITRRGASPPPTTRPTAARQAGRWLGKLMGGDSPEADADVAEAVAEALAALITGG